MQNLDDVIAIAEHEWRSMGVVQRERAALADDLRLELQMAAADGVTLEQLLRGDDIRALARNIAAEAGSIRLPYENKRLMLTALAGASPGLALAWLFPSSLPYVGGLLAFIGALLAVRIRMSDAAAIGRTVGAMALLLPIAGILITPMTIGFAAMTGYSTTLPVVCLEVAMVAGAMAGATFLARRWALAPALGPARLAASKGR